VSATIDPQPRSRAVLPPAAFAALSAALAAIAVIALLSYRSLTARSEAAAAVSHSVEVEDHVHRFLSAVKDAETGQRGFLLTGSEEYLTPYQLSLGAISAELATLRRVSADSPIQQQRLDTMAPLVSAKLAELQETIAHKRAGDDAGALAILRSDRGKEAMDRIRELVEGMLGTQQAMLATRTAAWEATVQWSSYTVFGGLGVLVAMVLVIGALGSRSFRAVQADTWTRRAQLALAGELQGDVRLESIGAKALRVLVDHFAAQVAALYVVEPGGELRRIAGHALAASAGDGVLRPGDGLTGEVARSGRAAHLRDVPEGYLDVSSALGKARPRELVIAPARADGVVLGVTELGLLRHVDATELAAIERMSESIALAIRTARDRSRLEDLLEEIQRQAEELAAQQEELRVSNQELEDQTRALEVSQGQLEDQQTELEQINAQLEEQAGSLELQRDELTRVSAELRRADDHKSQFLANMSHELRTPLNSSLILARLLADNRDGNLTPDQVRFAQTIHAAGNDLLTLINDILDLSKIEAGMLEVRPEPVAPRRLADELVQSLRPIAEHRQLALELRVDPSVPGAIESDPIRLRQILKNLLSNALKFTDQGGVTLEITASDGRVRFAVHDTGVGISADQHEVIFEPFRQADGSASRRAGGTGLGLSISRDLARMLGGDLHVVSAPGRGSTFTLTLPEAPPYPGLPRHHRRTTAVRSAVARPAAAVRPAATRPAPFSDDRDRVEPATRSLLIIEDDVAFARVIYDLAHELEFLGVVATTADDGLALARRTPPSAIVLDVGLPDQSGLAVLDALKHDPQTRHIPVHVVSAADHTRTALEMGATGYALKPVDRERLIEAIRQLEARFTQKLRRVLIVEDDAVLRDSTARLLAGEDVETVTAATAAEALDQIRTTTFDCMVLDLALPDRSGLELLDEMSRGERYGFPPVIVYTGRSLSHDEVHQLERFSRSIIIKGARSPERLLDEVTLFLHQVESRLSVERQRMLRDARDREAVFDGRRILIVEDDVRNLFALSNALEPRGAIVEIARNGREAIEHLDARPGVDLVLMDIMMPEMDGHEAIRRLRADPRFARLPIIALTAKAMIDDREKSIAAGASDYIAKPLDVDKLLSLARVWIRK
jgi:signal transduction histidine kinase/DNA-binding response OmpR family regulator/CHASE3 domain sensor protein